MMISKSYIKAVLFVALIVTTSLSYTTTFQETANLIRVNEKTLIPEGIAVHPKTGIIYLSSLHKHKIVELSANGEVTDLIKPNQQGFMQGLGMKFSKNGEVLWSCSADGKGNTGLFSIDPYRKKILNKYSHDSARFLNDLVILDNGEIYITDTEAGAVFRLHNKKLELFLKDEQLKWANGITVSPDGKILFVASGRYGLKRIDLVSSKISSATQSKRTDYAIDGLVMDKNKIYAAIGWPQDSLQQHRILRYRMDSEHNFISADTLSVQKPWLNVPTTLTTHNRKLYCLATTNIGVYNKQNQKIDLADSFQFPVVAILPL